MKNPADKRVVKTRRLIIDTFKSMIIEMDYEKITIKELASRANINRKTFYSHFDCIDEIINMLSEEVAEILIENLKKIGMFKYPSIAPFVKALNLTLDEDFELYRRVIMANSYKFFSRNVKNIVKIQVERSQLAEKITCTQTELDFCAEYLASGLAKIYKMWFEDSKGITKERFSELVGTMVFSGFSALLKSQQN